MAHLIFGACSPQSQFESIKNAYEKKAASIEPGPWLVTPSRDPEHRSIQSYSTYASILYAESLRFEVTADAGAQANIRHAAEYLTENSDDDGDGVPGWGIQWSWGAFGEAPLPAETAYSPDTAHVVRALIEALVSGAAPEMHGEIKAMLKAAVIGWSERYFTEDGDAGFYIYTPARHTEVFVPNASAYLGGYFAKFLALFPEEFSPNEAAAVRRTLRACARKLDQTWRPESQSWVYADFPTSSPFNDLGHHIGVLEGVELLRKYSGEKFSFTTQYSLDSLGQFYDGAELYQYPAEMRAEGYMEKATPVLNVYIADFLAQLGHIEESQEMLVEVFENDCGETSCPALSTIAAPAIFEGSL